MNTAIDFSPLKRLLNKSWQSFSKFIDELSLVNTWAFDEFCSMNLSHTLSNSSDILGLP